MNEKIKSSDGWGGMLAAGICLFAACGTANDDGTNNGVNDTSNTQVTNTRKISSGNGQYDWKWYNRQ